MITMLLVVHCLGSGLVAGVFFAFSAFVMRALASTPPEQGIAAMQQINVAVINPLFLGVFLGTGVVSLGILAAAAVGQGGTGAALPVAACLVYWLGSIGVTMGFNVPRNNRLAALDAHSPQGLDYWPIYVAEWLRWNHVRTVASVLSALLCVLALTP